MCTERKATGLFVLTSFLCDNDKEITTTSETFQIIFHCNKYDVGGTGGGRTCFLELCKNFLFCIFLTLLVKDFT